MRLGFGLGLQYSRLSGGGFEGMLNLFPNASLGLSLDKLDKNYTGSAIKVRRTSNQDELDIGFVNNELDTASLLDFVGSGNGFVTIIYDQIGSNNMTQTTAILQGQIVSNGEVILKGGKPCIIRRSASKDGGYLSTYAPNDGATVKGLFYVGDNEGKKSCMYGSFNGSNDRGVFCEASINTTVDSRQTITANKVNGVDVTFTNRQDSLDKLNKHFLLYREIDFNFESNVLGLGFRQNVPVDFGMMTFQELVIFENIDDISAKENNVNSRYNLY